ncbi:DUF995 domain-containing protein [Mesorhizobium sp. M7A.F.Ca.US.011.01.1.1]|uniref:DUF995 domain-containing protein n=1 Tax=Mesorhizobium sp. M7A.F.Ca.US.011.01.1.1 TaxID=2496741 RepID=UPI000FCB63DF|nr:DUF995 domain-containing protein [Mesorhizobium sp. M7A.F.Ca.US.011.01.1.1]RUX32886.1 DUF995 domain-containing protein [Mesorhizobium sp. M7A.F.Ca.US.011.01.1.1]
MKRVLGNCIGTALACSIGLFAFQLPATAKTATKIAEQAMRAEVVPDEGIYQMYQNRSWLWGREGAGYFAVQRRQFSAWTSDKARKLGYGDGIWFIPGGGKLCFRAKWHGAGGDSNALSCFEHRQAGRILYQRRVPDGEWYVFRSSHRNLADAFMQLKHGDYVSRKQSRIKAKQ